MILEEEATPAELIQMRRDFSEPVFIRMQEGEADARKAFNLAKCLMFTLLYEFTLAKFGWRFACQLINDDDCV